MPQPPPTQPLTAAERLLLVQGFQQDLLLWEQDHRQAGIRLPSAGIELSSLFFDPKAGSLACHAPGKACRVTLYMSGQDDGRTMVPTGIAEVAGTCGEFRRRRFCSHTLAAIRRLGVIVAEKSHPLREKLFRLGATEEWRQVLSLVDQFLTTSQSAEASVPEQPPTRVVWRIEYKVIALPGGSGNNIHLQVVPYEQKIGKAGNWTRGRRLSFEEFSGAQESWSHDADRRAAQRYKELHKLARLPVRIQLSPAVAQVLRPAARSDRPSAGGLG